MIKMQNDVKNLGWKDLWLEATKYGQLMTRGHLSRIEKVQAEAVFAELLSRCTDSKQKETIEKALKVLYYF